MAQEPDPRPWLIGLHGRKQSGKDTCGDRLVLAHGYTRVAFAERSGGPCRKVIRG